MRPNVPKVLAMLGYAKEIVIEHLENEISFTFPGKSFLLCSNGTGTALFIFKQAKVNPRQPLDPATLQSQMDRAGKVYERWSDFEWTGGHLNKVSEAQLKRLGKCVSITYESDKWTGKPTKYRHTFNKLPNVHLNHLDDPSLIQVSKGGLKVKAEGIVG